MNPRAPKKLRPRESLSSYLRQLTTGKKCEEADDKTICKFFQCKRVTKIYEMLAKKQKSSSMTAQAA